MFKQEFFKKNILELIVFTLLFIVVCFLMLIEPIEIVIVMLFVLSFFMLFDSMIRYKKFSIPSHDEKKRYKSISQKLKEERSEEEQNFYLEVQRPFLGLLVSKYSSIFAVLLLLLHIFFR